MTSGIKIAPGWNNTDGLYEFPFSPDMDGVEYPREIYTPATAYFDGKPFAVLRFPDIMTPADWTDSLSRAGLGDPSVKAARVTVRLPDENKLGYTTYNGVAMRSRSTTYRITWYRAPTLIVTRLETL